MLKPPLKYRDGFHDTAGAAMALHRKNKKALGATHPGVAGHITLCQSLPTCTKTIYIVPAAAATAAVLYMIFRFCMIPGPAADT